MSHRLRKCDAHNRATTNSGGVVDNFATPKTGAQSRSLAGADYCRELIAEGLNRARARSTDLIKQKGNIRFILDDSLRYPDQFPHRDVFGKAWKNRRCAFLVRA